MTLSVLDRPWPTVGGAGRWALALVLAVQMTGCAALRQRSPRPDPSPVPSDRVVAKVIPDPPLRMPPIESCLSPNCGSRKGVAITAIVLHHTASSANALSIARYFQKPQAQASSHYVVDRDGAIVRCVPDDMKAWHAGPSCFGGVEHVNDFSLGIEICNRGDGIEPYPDVQRKAVARLVAYLADRYMIPLDRVTRHRDVIVPRGLKLDPSDNLDFDGVVRMARHFLDDQALWLAQQRGDFQADWPVRTAQPAGAAGGG